MDVLNHAGRFIDLMHTEFCNWEEARLGIINGSGNLLRKPSDEEKESVYDRFKQIARACKLSIDSDKEYVKECLDGELKEKYMSSDEVEQVKLALFGEDMVAGDSGYNASNIASGTTSGDVVNAGPQTMKKKKRAKSAIKK